MVKSLKLSDWENAFVTDFRKRFVYLLSFEFKDLETYLALEILRNDPESSDSDAQAAMHILTRVTCSLRGLMKGKFRIVYQSLRSEEA